MPQVARLAVETILREHLDDAYHYGDEDERWAGWYLGGGPAPAGENTG